MKKKLFTVLILVATSFASFGQYPTSPAALQWADSVFNTLNND